MSLVAGSLLFDPHALTRLWDPGDTPSSEAAIIRWIFLGLLALTVGVSVTGMVVARRKESLRAERKRRRLKVFLSDCDVTAQEKALLDSLAKSGGTSVETVARTVRGFDRGVDALLTDLPETSVGDRLLLLRRIKTLRHKLSLDRVAPGVPLVSSREIEIGQEILLRLSTVPPSKGLMATVVDTDETGFAVEIPPGSVEQSPEAREYLEALERQLTRGHTLLEGRSGVASATSRSPVGLEVAACFLREGDAGYRFGTVVNAVHLGGAVVLQLAHPEGLVRERRRDYLRVPTAGDVYVAKLVDAEGRALQPEDVTPTMLDRHGKALDLSGGGFRLLTPELHVDREERLVARFPFFSAPLSERLFVVRVIHVYCKNTDFGLYFEELPEEVRDAVVHEVTEIHRQARAAVVASSHA